MGKGYKRKTRWRTLNIGAPPGEEDEEDGIRNGYAKVQENVTSTRNGQTGHKNGRTDSAGSTTSDYASDYASAASRSRRDDSGGSPSQPNKIIFNENEYTRITTPRQDVLFKKGYLSRRKVWASTASTSATPSTTESQSASHSTADGSETNEDQQLLDCKENGAEEYQAMMEPGAQVAYGTFYDHATGYYYEYPVMVVGPGPGIPTGPPMHNVLTAVPCGPVPLRPIEWINPAFVPKLGNEQYCVMDYQTAQLGQYPTLVDENGVPLTAQTENTNGSDEAYHENGNGSASWAGSVGDEQEPSCNNAETQDATTEASSENEVEEVARASVNSEIYLETALAQQLHVTHVAVPPIPEPYVYPGHYMFGPSFVNVNGVTIQSGPMVRNTGVTGGPTSTGACAKRRKKKKLSRRKSRRPLGPGNAEGEEQEEEDYSSEADNIAGLGQPGVANESGAAVAATVDSSSVDAATASHPRPLNPECQEFRPVLESRIVPDCSEQAIVSEQKITVLASSSGESTDREQRNVEASETHQVSPIVVSPIVSTENDAEDPGETKNSRIIAETSVSLATAIEKTEKLASRKSEEIEASPVDFAAEVFANVTTMAERALASRSVVEGTPMETEIGLDATAINFQEIEENHEIPTSMSEERNGEADARQISRLEHQDSFDEEKLPNGHDEERSESCERTGSTSDRGSVSLTAPESGTIAEKHHRDRTTINEKRGSRSASPGMINRTTTPINANSHRLPESYRSLVTRGTSVPSCSPPSLGATNLQTQQQVRNRKYTSKNPKFVREATPGPDLDDAQASRPMYIETRTTNDRTESISEPVVTVRISRDGPNLEPNDDEAIATGIEALENELHSLSMTEESGDSCAWMKTTNDSAEASNDDSGIESQMRLSSSSDHPITDAVTEWLRRVNSPELFVVTGSVIAESEPEDDELENEEQPKNLQGNPMPALSANISDAYNVELSRLASFGKFATNIQQFVDSTMNEREGIMFGNNDNSDIKCHENDETNSRGERRADNNERTIDKCASVVASKITSEARNDVDAKNGIEAAGQRLLNNCSSSRVVKNLAVNGACELTENDSVAGMRVAKSSRTNKNMASIVTSTRIMNSCRSQGLDETRRRNDVGNSGRDGPIENVELKLRRSFKIDDKNDDEGIVEDEDEVIGVRTFEKGQIVVTNEGKLLASVARRALTSRCNDAAARLGIGNDNGDDGRPKFRKITCEKSRMDERTSITDEASNGNSLGSIVEPDVLECWEVETVEPVATPRIRQSRGRSSTGEDNEDDDNFVAGKEATIDPAGMEIVRKYYRLEATGDSDTSVTSINDDYNDDDRANDNENRITRDSLIDRPGNINKSACSDDNTSIIGERMNEIVDRTIDDAVEVYESCYGKNEMQPYLIGLDYKYENRILYGHDPKREGAVPCKGACCNIQ